MYYNKLLVILTFGQRVPSLCRSFSGLFVHMCSDMSMKKSGKCAWNHIYPFFAQYACIQIIWKWSILFTGLTKENWVFCWFGQVVLYTYCWFDQEILSINTFCWFSQRVEAELWLCAPPNYNGCYWTSWVSTIKTLCHQSATTYKVECWCTEK